MLMYIPVLIHSVVVLPQTSWKFSPQFFKGGGLRIQHMGPAAG